MKRISRKEFLKKDVYIMYHSKKEYKDILELIEDNLTGVHWAYNHKKPTEEESIFSNRTWFINIEHNKLATPCQLVLGNKNQLIITYVEFKEMVESFNTELLNEYENEYLTGVIKALRIDIDYVIKKNPESSNDYLCISIDSDGANMLCLYAYATFVGLEYNKKYTLNELGIDVEDVNLDK